MQNLLPGFLHLVYAGHDETRQRFVLHGSIVSLGTQCGQHFFYLLA